MVNIMLKPSWYIMEKLTDSKKNDVLPEFQEFPLEKKLALEKNVFFYALWANKYFTYASKKLRSPKTGPCIRCVIVSQRIC